MNRFFQRGALTAALVANVCPVYADTCICFHYMLDKDTGYQTLEGSHETECGSHTGVSGLSSAGPTFEPNVLQKIIRGAITGGRVIAAPSNRRFEWIDDTHEIRTCTVPDIRKSAETQPVRTAIARTTTITFSVEKLPVARRDQARLAANGWNVALAAAGKKTRLLEVTGLANVRMYALNLTALTGVAHEDVLASTFIDNSGLSSHPEWLVPASVVVLNTAFDADFSRDPMSPVQTFGHEFGHVLGLTDVKGYQLMSNAAQYTNGSDITPAMSAGDYQPNVCEVTKLGDNGLP